MSDTSCSCMYENDSGTFWCEKTVGHAGPHEAALEWKDHACSNWQHGFGDEHKREGTRDE